MSESLLRIKFGSTRTLTDQVNHRTAYDLTGNRLSHQTSTDGTTTAANLLTDTTDYDSVGRVTQTVTPLGRATTYAYTWDASVADLAGNATGGWVHTTTDSMSRSTVDTLDGFGRIRRHQHSLRHLHDPNPPILFEIK